MFQSAMEPSVLNRPGHPPYRRERKIESEHYNFFGVSKIPKGGITLTWMFQNLPMTSLIVTIISLAFVGIAYATEVGMGYTMIVVGALEAIYITARYVIISYRLFSVGTPVKNSVFVVVDLKFAEFLAIASIITGMYFIDTTPGKTEFFTHPTFSPGFSLYGVWLYVVTVSVSVMTGTGYSSIVENALSTSVVFTYGITLSYYSTLIILGNLASHWFSHYAEPIQRK
jgi:Na+-transporting NADH:ubiquinone oxidoreductase subunit NqrE